MRGSLLTMGLVGMLSLVPSVGALGLLPTTGTPGDPTPDAPSAVHARYTLALQRDLDAFDVQVRLSVFELELRGPEGVPAQAIRDGGPAVHGLFEDAVRATIANELGRAFPESRPTLASVAFDYGASDADADPYRPGIGVVATAELPLTGALLGIPRAASGADWARAFFYSGGSARIERTVLVPAGFDAGLRIEVPQALRLATPGRQVGTAAEFSKDNMRGQATSPLYVRFEVGLLADQVPQTVLDGPLVRATFVADDETPLWLQAIPFTTGRYAADLDLVIEVPSLSTRLFETDLLPPNLRLEQVSADLVRVASRDGLVGGAELEAYFRMLIQENLQEDFGPDVVVSMDTAAFEKSLAQELGGAEVAPLIVHARTRLPIESDHMLSSSSIARSIGMVTGTGGSFDLKNEGDWRLELTLFYPEGADIQASDSLHRLQELDFEGREGFRVYLAQGESTHIKVWGRPGFAPAVFAIGLLELATLVAGGLYLARWTKARVRARRFPWASLG